MPVRGLYERLLTRELENALVGLDESLVSQFKGVHKAEVPDRVSLHLAGVLCRAIESWTEKDRVEFAAHLANDIVERVSRRTARPDEVLGEAPVVPSQMLSAVVSSHLDGSPADYPEPLMSLLDTALLTNSRGEPGVGQQLKTEVGSADCIDVVMAFIRLSALRPLLGALRKHCDFGRPLTVKVGNLNAQTVSYHSGGDFVGFPHEVRLEGQTTALATFDYADPMALGAGYVKTITPPNSEEATTFVRDGYGRATSAVTDDHETLMSYDWDGRLASVREPESDLHRLRYAANGQLSTYVHPSGDTGTDNTSWEFDDARRVVMVNFPLGTGTDGLKSIEFIRDEVGADHPGRLREVALLDGLGSESIQYVYGDEVYPAVDPEDPDPQPLGKPGQVHSIQRGALTTEFGWNGPLNTREEYSSVPYGMTAAGISNGYNHQFQLASRTLLVDGEPASAASFYYNDDAQIDAIVADGPPLDFTYNPQHGMLEAVDIGGISEDIFYDDYGRLSIHAAQQNEIPFYEMTVPSVGGRDALGRITQQIVSIDGSEVTFDYTYDARGQLKTTTRTPSGGVATTTTNQYDSNGNKACTHTGTSCPQGQLAIYGNDNQLTSIGNVSFTYDSMGRLSQVGELATGGTAYTYDLQGSLREVASSAGKIIYRNDHAGRRIQRTVTGASGSTISQKQYVWSSSLQIEAELEASGQVVSRFVYGLRPNVPELIVRGDDTYRVVTDHLGSPVYVVNVDDPSDVLLKARYDEWGNPTILYSKLNANGEYVWPIPHGFAGGLYDEGTGLVRFGARDYDPSVGRWTAKDPSLFGGQQSNLYVYAHNDPMSYVDPEGEIAWFIVIGAALLLGSDAVLTDPGEIAQMEGQAQLGGAILSMQPGPAASQFAAQGRELSFGRNWRLAPFGNRTGHPYGRWPHYHRRGTGEGQGIGRHRPWETKKPDKNFCDRF